MGAMEVQIPLIDGENVLDSEVLIEANLRAKSIQRMIIGGFSVIIGIILLILMTSIGDIAFYGGYGLICLGIILIVSGVLYLKDTSSYGIVITNFRLIEQYLYQNTPAKVIEHHYEFFESTEVPFHHQERPKAAIIFSVIGILILIGGFIANFLDIQIIPGDSTTIYTFGGSFIIAGILWFFLGGKKPSIIHFQITKTSQSKLIFLFPIKKFTEERIYAIINQIILASREFINKTAI